ncbi:MAG: alpha/beta fold hydrolase [Burkholderiales bacterium]|nr:alpha/beta fold hydrolase [Burkholderiales bacterium]
MRAARRLAAICLALLAAAAQAEELAIAARGGRLHGTIERPAGGPPAVCALIVAGSGPTDRDGNQPGLASDSLKQLARGLAARGICTLRYDKRGVGASNAAAPDERALRFEHIVADAAAWAGHLKRIGGAPRLALIGHGEGALVALLAAGRGEAFAAVSVAGAGRPAVELIGEQLRRLPEDPRRRGMAILDELAAGRLAPNVPAEFGALFRPSVQPYLMSWLRYDPAAEIRAPGLRVLIVQGTADLQVPVSEARVLAAANRLADLSIIPGMNHVLKHCRSDADQLAAYTDPATPIEPRVVETIAEFLLRTP